MKQIIVATILTVAFRFTAVSQGLSITATGAGTAYRLNVVQDVCLERSTRNYNYLQYLLVSKHPQYPNKRSLVQFENLPSSCPSANIMFAKMYLYFAYAHKASWHSVEYTPYIPRHLQVHLVKKSWREDQATSGRRLNGVSWSVPWLGLDNNDAEASPQQGTVTIFTNRPAGFVEFDVTDAVRKWRNGIPNNGLLIRATNEMARGRGIRFYSKSYGDASKHAFVNVLCAQE